MNYVKQLRKLINYRYVLNWRYIDFYFTRAIIFSRMKVFLWPKLIGMFAGEFFFFCSVDCLVFKIQTDNIRNYVTLNYLWNRDTRKNIRSSSISVSRYIHVYFSIAESHGNTQLPHIWIILYDEYIEHEPCTLDKSFASV